MQSNVKLSCYRRLRNQICSEIAKKAEIYKDVSITEEYNTTRKNLLEQIAFYKDVLAILSKNKDMLIDGD